MMLTIRTMRKPIIATIVTLIAVLVCIWLTFPTTNAIRYHLDCLHALQRWPKRPSTFRDYFRYRTLLWYMDGKPSIPQVFEKIHEHQQALVEFGYFKTHDFVLVHRTFDVVLDPKAINEFNAVVTNAASKSAFKDLTTWTTPHGKPSVVRVIARQEDMPAWESIISRFDSQSTR